LREELLKAIELKSVRDCWMYIFMFRLNLKNFMNNCYEGINIIRRKILERKKAKLIVRGIRNRLSRYGPTIAFRKI